MVIQSVVNKLDWEVSYHFIDSSNYLNVYFRDIYKTRGVDPDFYTEILIINSHGMCLHEIEERLGRELRALEDFEKEGLIKIASLNLNYNDFLNIIKANISDRFSMIGMHNL